MQENESVLATYFPSAILSCGGMMERDSAQPQDVDPDWQHDVQWGENTIISITEAFLVFKLVLLLAEDFNKWWVTAVAFGLTLVVLIGGITYARHSMKTTEKHKLLGSKFEHILATLSALLIGILLVNFIQWCGAQIFSDVFILIQIQILFACVVFAMVCILILGCHFSTLERSTGRKMRFGMFHVQNNREEHEETEAAVGVSHEVYVFAIMISISLSDLFDAVLSVLISSSDLFQGDPVLFKALFALLALFGVSFFWRYHLLPEAVMSVDDHQPVKGQDESRF